jgi:hypothetical protein
VAFFNSTSHAALYGERSYIINFNPQERLCEGNSLLEVRVKIQIIISAHPHLGSMTAHANVSKGLRVIFSICVLCIM